jgi:hydrogenase/urease accessory protein HupE
MNCRKYIFWLSFPLFARLLSAHTVSLTYAEVAVEEQHVRWSLKLPVPELDLLLDLDENHDGTVDAAELARSQDKVRQYVLSKLGVADGGQEVRGSLGVLRTWKDAEGHLFIQTEALFPSPGRSFGRLVLRCDLLREVVTSHRTLAKITAGGQVRDFVFEGGRSFQVDAQPSIFHSALQFIRMGIWHIFTGYDHIAFLIGVLLIGGSFKTMLKIVTSFTIAHSITLALAAFGIVNLPSWFVESGIALSIMYIALENLFFKKFDRRWMITFFFGLVHGFGFASALKEVHLSGRLLVTALFSFNFGVEAGQLCIAATLLPAIVYLSRQRSSAVVVRVCSVMIFALGTFWFWMRISERS